MRNLEPSGMGQRVLGALALLLLIAWAAHEAYALLRPLIPTLITLVVLGGVASLVFRRWR